MDRGSESCDGSALLGRIASIDFVAQVAELVHLKVDIIVTNTGTAAQAR